MPPAKITMRPFSKCRNARRCTNGSATLGISMAVCSRVSSPIRSKAFCSARPLMIVASMPM